MNLDELNHRGEIPIQKIYDYIMGNLGSVEMKEMESQIKASQEDFQTYLDLRSAIHLMKQDVELPSTTRDKVLTMIQQTSIKKYIQFKIQSFQDKISISSSDQEDLIFSGVIADFAVRGSKPGVISIARNIDGEDVQLVLTPIPDKRSYSLEIHYEAKEKINCILFVNGEEWEVVRDIASHPQFHSVILENSELKLEFKNKQELKFTLGITLVND